MGDGGLGTRVPFSFPLQLNLWLVEEIVISVVLLNYENLVSYV